MNPRKRIERRGALVNLQDLAREVGLPATTIKDLVFRGLLPVIRPSGGRRWWFKRTDVEQLIETSSEIFDPKTGAFVRTNLRRFGPEFERAAGGDRR
jgi:excisionase family DNA binding protein